MDARPELKFRLRDRSNSLEIAGRTAFPYRLRKTLTNLDYNWNLSIARINRRWGWGLNHSEIDRPIIRDDYTLPHYRYSVSNAYVQYREFSPRGPFQNLQGNAGVYAHWQDESIEKHSYQAYANLSALDRHFRSYSVSLNTVPYWRKVRYQQAGVEIFQKVSPEIGGGLGFQTDNRKPLQLNTQIYGSSGMQGEFPTLLLALQPRWVLGRKLQLNMHLQANTFFQTLEVLSTQGGRWIFEQSDIMDVQARVGVNWYPADRLQLSLNAGVREQLKLRRRAVELFDGGTLLPVNADLSKAHREWSPVVQLGGTYVFSSISQVRFTMNYAQDDLFLRFPTLPSTFYPKATASANLSFVWFIDGSKYR